MRHLFCHLPELYSLPNVKANFRHYLTILRSRMLQLFTSERKGKHPTCILPSSGDVFTSKRKSKHPTFNLPSYRAECCRYSLPNVKVTIRHVFCHLPELYSLPNVKANIRHLTYHHMKSNVVVIHFLT